MKILLVNKFFYRRGGCETYFFALGEALQKAGHQIIWFSMQHPQNEPCPQSNHFVTQVDYHTKLSPLQRARDAIKLLYSFEARRNLERLIEKERPDIMHINNVHRQITLSIVDAARKYGIPVVATVHDSIYVCPSYVRFMDGVLCERCHGLNYLPCVRNRCVMQSRSKSLLAAVEAFLNRVRGVYRHIDAYLVPSAFLCEGLRKAGYTDSPIYHLPNFLIPAVTVDKGEENSEQPFFLYIGRLSAEKGLMTLLDAYDSARPGPALLIVGDGPQREALEARVKAMGLEAFVQLTGERHGEELATLMQNCLGVVLPSEWLENFPYAVMEAMAAGKPVIASRVGGIPELVEDGVTGFLFEMGSTQGLAQMLVKLAGALHEELNQMGDLARERVNEAFSQEAYLATLTQIYTDLLSKKDNRPRQENP